MLEDVTIRYGESHFRLLDRGNLAEALAFFGQVRIVVHPHDLKGLFSSVTHDELSTLLKDGFLEFVFIPDSPVCATYRNSSGLQESDFDFIRLKLETNSGIISDPLTILEFELKRSYPHIRNFSSLLERTKVFPFESIIPTDPVQFVTALKERIVSTQFGTDCCAEIVNYLKPPTVPAGLFHCRFAHGEYGLVAESPLREDVTVTIPSVLPGKPPFKFLPGSFLTAMLDTAFEAAVADKFSTCVEHSELGTACAVHYYASICRIPRTDLERLSVLSEHVFEGMPRVDFAVRSGQKNIIDLIPIIERKNRFSDWCGKIGTDQTLLAAYIKEISKESWVDRLPVKGARFATFTAGGMALEAFTAPLGLPGAATAGGIALGAVDTFLMDRILNGWSPKIYVESLQAFAKP